MNLIPPEIAAEAASFGKKSVSIIPSSIDITGAPIISNEKPPISIPPASVDTPAITAQRAMPDIVLMIFFFFSSVVIYVFLYSNE